MKNEFKKEYMQRIKRFSLKELQTLQEQVKKKRIQARPKNSFILMIVVVTAITI